MLRTINKVLLVVLIISSISIESFSSQFKPLIYAPVELAYYGADFYVELAKGIKDDQLQKRIKDILKMKHIASKSGYDEIAETCKGGSSCYQQSPLTYNQARTLLLGRLHLINQGTQYFVKDVYCLKMFSNQDFGSGSGVGPDKVPDNNILNTEHTWPKSRFSKKWPYEVQVSDLHHLFPTDSEMNSTRSSFKFGEVVFPQRVKCGASKFGTSDKGGSMIFEPPNEHKGNVARALFYFSTRYDISIDQDEEVVLRKWNKLDPVDDSEQLRNDAIYKAQGNRNPYVDYPELVDKIENF